MIRKMVLEMKQVRTAWFPFVMTLVLFSFLFFTRNFGDIELKINILTQTLLPFMGVWLPLSILSEFVQVEQKDFFFTFSFLKNFRGVGLFLFWLGIGLGVVLFNVWLIENFLHVQIPALFLFAQTAFFASASYAILTLSRSFGWSVLLMMLMMSSALLTQGKLYGRFSFYFPDLISMHEGEIVGPSLWLIVTSVVLMTLGALFLQKGKQMS